MEIEAIYVREGHPELYKNTLYHLQLHRSEYYFDISYKFHCYVTFDSCKVCIGLVDIRVFFTFLKNWKIIKYLSCDDNLRKIIRDFTIKNILDDQN